MRWYREKPLSCGTYCMPDAHVQGDSLLSREVVTLANRSCGSRPASAPSAATTWSRCCTLRCTSPGQAPSPLWTRPPRLQTLCGTSSCRGTGRSSSSGASGHGAGEGLWDVMLAAMWRALSSSGSGFMRRSTDTLYHHHVMTWPSLARHLSCDLTGARDSCCSSVGQYCKISL